MFVRIAHISYRIMIIIFFLCPLLSFNLLVVVFDQNIEDVEHNDFFQDTASIFIENYTQNILRNITKFVAILNKNKPKNNHSRSQIDCHLPYL